MASESIHVVGVSHKTASLSERERFAFSRERRRRILHERPGESVLLVTCNRTELYALAPSTGIERSLLDVAGVREAPLFCLSGLDAARHLFSVASGLDSMVVGEPQILGQVKRAMAEAREAGALGPVLDELVRRAVAVGRRARRETDLGRGLPSIPKVATGMVRLVLGELGGRRMLIVGAGKLGELTARAIRRAGAASIVVTNRSAPAAEELAAAIGGRAQPFERLPELLAEADIVLSCTAAEAPVITRVELARALERGKGRPLVLVDIAVPRDVAADVRELPGVRLCDLDDLREWASDSVAPATIEAAFAIVEEEARDFEAWRAGLSAVPTIRALQARAERILAEEVERAGGDPEALRLFGRRVLKKMLHHPIRRLKDGAASDGEPYVQLARQLFALDGDRGVEAGGRDAGNGTRDRRG